MNETLPKADAAIKATAVRMGLETVTNNCFVSVAVSGEKGSKNSIKFISLDDLKKLEPNAIKRKLLRLPTAAEVQMTESHQREKNVYEQKIDS